MKPNINKYMKGPVMLQSGLYDSTNIVKTDKMY